MAESQQAGQSESLWYKAGYAYGEKKRALKKMFHFQKEQSPAVAATPDKAPQPTIEDESGKLPIWEQVAQLEAYRAGAKQIEDGEIILKGIESLINTAKDKHKAEFDVDAQKIAAATEATPYVRNSRYDTTKSSGLLQELAEAKKRYETLVLVYSRREALMNRLATADLNADNAVFSQLATAMYPARDAVVQELSKAFEISDLDQVAASITTFLTAKIKQYKSTLEEAVVNQAVAVFVEEFITERKSAEKPKETATAMAANGTPEGGAEANSKKDGFIKSKLEALFARFNAKLDANREESFDSLPSSQKAKQDAELKTQLESLNAQKKELSAELAKLQSDRNKSSDDLSAAVDMAADTPEEIQAREAAIKAANDSLKELKLKNEEASEKLANITDQEKLIKEEMERPLHERVLLSIAGAELGDTRGDVLKKWLSMDSLKREALPTTIAGAVGFGVSVGSGFFGVSPMVRTSIGFALMSGTAAGSAISYGKLSAAKEKAGGAGWLKTRDIYEKGADLMAWIFKNNHVVYAFSAGMIAGAQVQSFAGMASADAQGIAGLAQGGEATPTPDAVAISHAAPPASQDARPTPNFNNSASGAFAQPVETPTPPALASEPPVQGHESGASNSGSVTDRAMQSFYAMFDSLGSGGVHTSAQEQHAAGPQPQQLVEGPQPASHVTSEYGAGLTGAPVTQEHQPEPGQVTFAVQSGESPEALAARISENLPAGVHIDPEQLATAITDANEEAIDTGNVWDVTQNKPQDSRILNFGSDDHRSDAVTINTTTGDVAVDKDWVEGVRTDAGKPHQDIVGHATVAVEVKNDVETGGDVQGNDGLPPATEPTTVEQSNPQVTPELPAGTTLEYSVQLYDDPEKIADGLIAQLPEGVTVDRAALITSITNTNEQAIQQFHIVDQNGQPVDSHLFNYSATHPDTAKIIIDENGKAHLQIDKEWLQAVRKELGTWDNQPIVASSDIQLHATTEVAPAQTSEAASAQTAAPVAPAEAPAPAVEQPVATLDSVLLGIDADHPDEVKDFLSFVTEHVMTVDEQHTPASNLGQLSPDHIDKFAQVVDNVVADVEDKNGLNINNISDNQMETIGLSPARQEIVHILQNSPGDHAQQIALAITQDGQILELFNQKTADSDADVDGIIERLEAIIK